MVAVDDLKRSYHGFFVPNNFYVQYNEIGET